MASDTKSVSLGRVSEFPDGEGVRVDIDELPFPIAVFNLGGEFYAISDRCPHKGAPLSRASVDAPTVDARGTWGPLDSDTKSVCCPWHGLEFDLHTGECLATSHRVATFDVERDNGDLVLTL